MKGFLKYLLLASFIGLVASASLSSTENPDIIGKCGIWTGMKFTYKCRSLFYDVMFVETKDMSPKGFETATRMCDKSYDCLASFECEEIKRLRESMEKTCRLVGFAYPDNMLCLRGFFRKAYVAQFSNEDSCFKQYSFLDKDLNERRSAFTNGKLCFVKHTREYCNSTSIEYFNADKYDKLVESMSTQPEDRECKNAGNFLKIVGCTALSEELMFRIDQLKQSEFQSNQTFVSQTLKICKDTEACIEHSCLMSGQFPLTEEHQHCRNLKNQFPSLAAEIEAQ